MAQIPDNSKTWTKTKNNLEKAGVAEVDANGTSPNPVGTTAHNYKGIIPGQEAATEVDDDDDDDFDLMDADLTPAELRNIT